MSGVFGWSRPFTEAVLDAAVFGAAREAGVMAPAAEAGCFRASVRAATLEGQVFLHSAFPTEAAESVFFGPDTYRFADAVTRALAGRTQATGARPVHRVADIGCGSGAVGILVARAYPEAAVFLADINVAALRLAAVNAAAAGVENAACVRSDLFGALEGAFDLIVANPPYLLDPAARIYRHGGGELGEGLSLRILEAALPRLAPGGMLVLYTGSAILGGRDVLGERAAEIVAGTGWAWTYREADPDVFGEELESAAYAGADRIAAVVLTVERPA